MLLKDGAIIDASIVQVPVSVIPGKKTNKFVKATSRKIGRTNPISLNKKIWMQTGPRKTVKHFFGYKNHIKINNGSKLITNYQVTPASVHDSVMLEDLLDTDEADQPVYADSAYSGKIVIKLLRLLK